MTSKSDYPDAGREAFEALGLEPLSPVAAVDERYERLAHESVAAASDRRVALQRAWQAARTRAIAPYRTLGLRPSSQVATVDRRYAEMLEGVGRSDRHRRAELEAAWREARLRSDAHGRYRAGASFLLPGSRPAEPPTRVIGPCGHAGTAVAVAGRSARVRCVACGIHFDALAKVHVRRFERTDECRLTYELASGVHGVATFPESRAVQLDAGETVTLLSWRGVVYRVDNHTTHDGWTLRRFDQLAPGRPKRRWWGRRRG